MLGKNRKHVQSPRVGKSMERYQRGQREIGAVTGVQTVTNYVKFKSASGTRFSM